MSVPQTASRRRLAVGASALLVMALGGTASAYWSALGGGGAQSRSQVLTVEVTASLPPTSTLVPGGTAVVAVSVRNTSATPVRVTSVLANGPATSTAGCADPRVTFTSPTSIPPGAIAPGATTVLTLANAATMALDSPSACQGRPVTVPVRVQVTGA